MDAAVKVLPRFRAAATTDMVSPPLGVDSAFNGLGLYRAAALRSALAAQCRYRGTKNSYLCEHVPFHLCMRRAALSIGVLPSLETDCGVTTVTPMRKRVSLLANGSVAVDDGRAPPKPKGAIHLPTPGGRLQHAGSRI